VAESIRFTKPALSAIAATDRRQYYRDKAAPRLYLGVTPAGTKVFYAQVTVDGATVRHRLGQFPDLSVQRARVLAEKAAGDAAEGKDPGAERKRRLAQKMTLQELLGLHIENRENDELKPGTIADYRRALREFAGDWLDKPAAVITEEMVIARYRKLGRTSKARTDNGFRVLRAVFNTAFALKDKHQNRLFPVNPTEGVVESKMRFKPRRRRTKIDNDELPAWWVVVHELEPVARNLFVFRLLTGTRVTEAATLRWADVNLRRRVFWLRDTKTGEDAELPLPDYAASLLLQTKLKDRSEYVFPNSLGEPVLDTKRAVRQIRATTETGFTPYDTRRTFISTANGLNINHYTVKALVNHSRGTDVTAGYDVADMERLRAASRAIEERFLRLAHAVDAKVVRLRSVT